MSENKVIKRDVMKIKQIRDANQGEGLKVGMKNPSYPPFSKFMTSSYV